MWPNFKDAAVKSTVHASSKRQPTHSKYAEGFFFSFCESYKEKYKKKYKSLKFQKNLHIKYDLGSPVNLWNAYLFNVYVYGLLSSQFLYENETYDRARRCKSFCWHCCRRLCTFEILSPDCWLCTPSWWGSGTCLLSREAALSEVSAWREQALSFEEKVIYRHVLAKWRLVLKGSPTDAHNSADLSVEPHCMQHPLSWIPCLDLLGRLANLSLEFAV